MSTFWIKGCQDEKRIHWLPDASITLHEAGADPPNTGATASDSGPFTLTLPTTFDFAVFVTTPLGYHIPIETFLSQHGRPGEWNTCYCTVKSGTVCTEAGSIDLDRDRDSLPTDRSPHCVNYPSSLRTPSAMTSSSQSAICSSTWNSSSPSH